MSGSGECACPCCDLGGKNREACPARDTARASIARYLDHVGSMAIGSVLSPHDREIVAWCASWVRSELDVEWGKEMESRDGQCDECRFVGEHSDHCSRSTR